MTIPFQAPFQAPANCKIGIVVGRFNELVTAPLLEGALQTLQRYGIPSDAVRSVWVPGAVEIPLAAKWLAADCDAVIALGAVIQGSTSHFDYVCSMVASGLQSVALESNTPCIFGVLTTETLEQALERAGSKAGNKGSEAAHTALEMLHLKAHLA